MALMTPGAVRVGTGEWGQALSEVEGVAEPLAAVLRALPGPASRRTSLDDSGVQQGHHPLPARARRHCPATAIRCLCPTVALVGALSPITATTRQVIGTGHCPGHRGRRLRPTAWEHCRPCIVERHPLAPAPAPLLWARGGIGGCGGGATRAAEPPRGLASEPARGLPSSPLAVGATELFSEGNCDRHIDQGPSAADIAAALDLLRRRRLPRRPPGAAAVPAGGHLREAPSGQARRRASCGGWV